MKHQVWSVSKLLISWLSFCMKHGRVQKVKWEQLKCAVALVAKRYSKRCSGCMNDCICGEIDYSFDGDKERVNFYCTSMKALVERKTITQLSHSRRRRSRKLGACPGTACVQQKDFLSSSRFDMNHLSLLNNVVSVPGTGHPRVIKLSGSISSVWQGTNMSVSISLMEHALLIITTLAYFHWSSLDLYRHFIFHNQYN